MKTAIIQKQMYWGIGASAFVALILAALDWTLGGLPPVTVPSGWSRWWDALAVGSFAAAYVGLHEHLQTFRDRYRRMKEKILSDWGAFIVTSCVALTVAAVFSTSFIHFLEGMYVNTKIANYNDTGLAVCVVISIVIFCAYIGSHLFFLFWRIAVELPFVSILSISVMTFAAISFFVQSQNVSLIIPATIGVGVCMTWWLITMYLEWTDHGRS